LPIFQIAAVRTISDPVARKLVEWTILRSDETQSIDLSRYMAFITENPSWPSTALLRRRAEATLWADRLDPAFVRAFFGKDRPLTTKGKFALARALLLQGDRAGAQSLVREAWRNDTFSDELESPALDVFKDLITPADHKVRMDMRLYAEDTEGALRSANRAGGNAQVIARARIAVINKAANAKALLDAVPAEARRDVGYIFSYAQLLRRANEATEAGDLILSLPADHGQTLDSDQWWIERRLVARKLLDLGEAKAAYRVARDAAIPNKDNYRAEHQFTAGWIQGSQIRSRSRSADLRSQTAAPPQAPAPQPAPLWFRPRQKPGWSGCAGRQSISPQAPLRATAQGAWRPLRPRKD
jgi:soluble lytic murein transglycosylase